MSLWWSPMAHNKNKNNNKLVVRKNKNDNQPVSTYLHEWCLMRHPNNKHPKQKATYMKKTQSNVCSWMAWIAPGRKENSKNKNHQLTRCGTAKNKINQHTCTIMSHEASRCQSQKQPVQKNKHKQQSTACSWMACLLDGWWHRSHPAERKIPKNHQLTRWYSKKAKTTNQGTCTNNASWGIAMPPSLPCKKATCAKNEHNNNPTTAHGWTGSHLLERKISITKIIN